MAGHEARINNVMDDGKGMIDEGTFIFQCMYVGWFVCFFVCLLGRVSSELTVFVSFPKRSFPKRRNQRKNGWP